MKSDEAFERCRRLPQIEATLLFDTASEANPHNVRRGQDLSRHLLYEANGLCLDVRIDRDPDTWEAVVIGQVADRRDPLKPAHGMPVWLLSERQPVASTQANRVGEFRFSCPPANAMSLCLTVESHGRIEVPIEPLWQAAGESALEGKT